MRCSETLWLQHPGGKEEAFEGRLERSSSQKRGDSRYSVVLMIAGDESPVRVSGPNV